MGIRRLTTVQKRAASAVRGAGVFEKTMNQLGLLWHQNFAVFDFAKHAEIQTHKDLDHISAGNESSETRVGKFSEPLVIFKSSNFYSL